MNGIEQQNTYWARQLSDPPPPPKLPWDKEPPPVSSFLRETVSTKIDAETWDRIKHLTMRVGASPQAVLLAALKTLLFRYTGQTDLIVGTLLSATSEPSRYKIAALRTRLDGHATAEGLTLQVAASLREAREHLDLPFRAIIEASGHSAGEPESGLFNIALIFLDTGGGQTSLPCSVETECAEHLMACALVLRAHATDDYLTLNCEYDAELLESATVQRLAVHLGNLLAAMAAKPHKTLDRLDLLSGAELRQLLKDWNATETEVPHWGGIHQLIEAQAKRTPEAVAVICRDRSLTYAELNARANQVASYLSKRGVGTEVLVGICVARSLEMLVGLLGILKSGGAYLPLDPAYPAERLAFMIKDAQVRVLLTQERLVAALPPGETPRVLLDAHWPSIGAEPAETVDRGVASHNLAYVIYTSGSTGTPKGVMVEHRNVLNFFAGMDARIQHRPGSTWLAVTSPSFDISVLELFWTLARGFKVIIQPDDDYAQIPAMDGKSTDKEIDFGGAENRVKAGLPDSNGRGVLTNNTPAAANGRWRSVPEQILWHGVTHLQCTPSLAKTLVLAPESREAMRLLGKLLLGGESLPVSLAKQLR